ncbi:MAG TPA: dihydropteroate synthase, partial [Clostridiales bacterium]|nr:dihydropteroate synthase [Clostridiales bacterium]
MLTGVRKKEVQPLSPTEQRRNSEEMTKPAVFRARRFSFPLGCRTYIMGVLNVTPDSFSDGGKYLSLDDALRRAGEMLDQGADILDIGGESTRPGGAPVSSDEEMRRVIPVITQVSQKFGCPISIDTYKADVARAALSAGACLINDINGLQQDQAIAAIAAQHQAGVAIMHNARLYRNQPAGTPAPDLMGDVESFLLESIKRALQAGLCRDHLMIDPGIGFGVTAEESLEMIAQLNRLSALNLP